MRKYSKYIYLIYINHKVIRIISFIKFFYSTDDDAIDVSEKYLPGYMPDPGAQHMWDMLSTRALKPDKPLPSIADDVKNLLEPPDFVREKCKPVTERIKNLFFLEKKQPLSIRK